MTATANINIIVLPGLGSWTDQIISTGKQSATLHLTGDLSSYGIEIHGPYYYNEKPITASTLYVSTTSGKFPYFNIICRNIDSFFTISSIADAIIHTTNGLKFINVTSANAIYDSADNIDITAGGYRLSTVKTKIEYISGGSNADVELQDAWLSSYNGVRVDDLPEPYQVTIDNNSPTGTIKAATEETGGFTTVGSSYVVAKQNIKIYVGDIQDTGSGVYQIHIKNESTGSWETREIISSNRFVDWRLPNTNTTQQITYKLEDNAGNITTVEQYLNIIYNERSNYRRLSSNYNSGSF